ncbi:MAG: hypothetical protein V9H26_01180 [Verrucomicrobiota bacterium]
MLWKLRALHAVKSFSGTRIVALGGPWGKYAPDAPQKCQERFGLKIVDVSYDDFGPRVQRALADAKVMAAAAAGDGPVVTWPCRTPASRRNGSSW